MNSFHTCSCSSGGGIEDFLNCAPCPPPILTYFQLKIAAAGKLCQKEVCSIARRCGMKESEALTTDCSGHVALSKCDLTCIIIIVCVLSVAFLIMVFVVVYKRKKSYFKQDTINVVFNDTDSENSDKSSDSGLVKIKKKHTSGHKSNVALQEHTNEAIHNQEDILDPDTIVIGTTTVPDENAMQINGTQQVEQDGLDEQGSARINSINGHSHVIVNGVRSRVNADKNDSCTSVKL
ncbi:uncharacterized protein LOC128547832 [Mercenaria mercenaria]|uniref:uncharacterized protein LOC128547832 n=1 Tax=Mercenaria mercenaria TaxID=6596 RepID=UPI00234F3BB5|nr:uncharacterized protein LOC128547832 [Mercenaria mercenaria]